MTQSPRSPAINELLRRHEVSPGTALMIEDMARNLVPAAALGMTTAWVRNSADWAVDGCEGDHIHHIVDDLGTFLTSALWAAPNTGRQDNSAICLLPIRFAES